MLYNPTISTIDLVIPDFPYINVFILILCIYESSPKDKKDAYFFWTDNIHFTSFFLPHINLNLPQRNRCNLYYAE